MMRPCPALVPLALALFVTCAIPAPGWADNDCGGGGKPRPDEGGIGGTGHGPVVPDEDDSGVGGTGISADAGTGIIGTITGFASICVGGVEIHYGADSVMQIDGEPASAAQLAVGQLVEVVASGTGDEVRARQISVRHIVAGPVTGIDPDANALDVIGQRVQLLPGTSGDVDPTQSTAARDYALGTVVRVSGLRRGDGVIVASRVARGDSETAQLTGPVARVEAGLLAVGATRVGIASDARVEVGDEVRVSGRWDGSTLVASAIETVPRLPFGGRVARVEVEGYARREGEQLHVGAFVFDVPRTISSGAVTPDVPLRVRAVIQERRAIIEHIGVLGERPTRPQPHEGGAHGPAHHPKGEQPAVQERGQVPAHGHQGRPDVDARSRPDRPEQPNRPDRPAPPDRPPRIERPQIPDRSFVPERPPRPERPDLPR